MIHITSRGESFDADRDLTAVARHILQKLRKKKEEALRTGWNNSGPILEIPAMKKITQDLGK